MGLLASLFESRSLENPRLSLSDPEAWADILHGGESESGARVSQRKVLGLPAVWRGVNVICNNVSKVPFHRQRKSVSGWESDVGPSHRMWRRKWNDLLSAREGVRTLTFHALLRGNGFALIWRDAQGRAVELFPLDPNETAVAKVGGKVWYVSKIAGKQRRIPSEDVFHLRGLSWDGLVGYDVLDLMCDAFGLPLTQRSYSARFFKDGSNQAGVLMVPGGFPDDKIRNILATWNEMATGIARSHRVALVSEGVKFQPTTVDAQKTQLLQSREFGVREMACILGVPPHLLGDTTRSSHNSQESERQDLLDFSLDPWFVSWESEADLKTTSEDDQEAETVRHEFNRRALARADMGTRNSSYATGRQWGWLTVDEIRNAEGYPLLGGDVGNQLLIPTNMTPVGTDGKPLLSDAGTGDGSGDNRAARSAFESLLVDRLERLAGVERSSWDKRGIRTTADAWAAAFWPKHQNHVLEAVAPVLRAWEAVSGESVDGRGEAFARAWADAGRSAIAESGSVAERDLRALASALLGEVDDDNE